MEQQAAVHGAASYRAVAAADGSRPEIATNHNHAIVRLDTASSHREIAKFYSAVAMVYRPVAIVHVVRASVRGHAMAAVGSAHRDSRDYYHGDLVAVAAIWYLYLLLQKMGSVHS